VQAQGCLGPERHPESRQSVRSEIAGKANGPRRAPRAARSTVS
jgi:hypothetical protein